MSRAEDLMFQMDDVNPEANVAEACLSEAYAQWRGATRRNADIRMTAELAAIFGLLNGCDDDDKVANL